MPIRRFVVALSAVVGLAIPGAAQTPTLSVAPAMGELAVDWAVFLCEYAPFLTSPTRDRQPPARLAVRKSSKATAGRCDQLENSLVVGLEEVGLVVSPERRLKTDAGDVYPVAVEQRDPSFEPVSLEIDVVLAVDKLDA